VAKKNDAATARAARLATIGEAHYQWEQAHAQDLTFRPEDNYGSGDYAVEHHQIEDSGVDHLALVQTIRDALGVDGLAAVTAAGEDTEGDAELDLTGQGPQAAGVALVCPKTSRVLMLQRGLDDESDPAAGTWEFPGGRLQDDEAPADGAQREWEEEIGQKWPETATPNPVHIWMSDDGVYQGLVYLVPDEKDVDLSANRSVQNPDDDYSEQAAWWDPDHAANNPALREECQATPWEALKNAASSVPQTTPDGEDAAEAVNEEETEEENG
jgi:8-oxo-dGTP pyrophosphatase MutT (NUDIX family)